VSSLVQLEAEGFAVFPNKSKRVILPKQKSFPMNGLLKACARDFKIQKAGKKNHLVRFPFGFFHLPLF
jgi:hypothetical protein